MSVSVSALQACVCMSVFVLVCVPVDEVFHKSTPSNQSMQVITVNTNKTLEMMMSIAFHTFQTC